MCFLIVYWERCWRIVCCVYVQYAVERSLTYCLLCVFAVCSGKVVDVVFAVDSSNNVDNDAFLQQVNLLQDLSSSLPISQSHTRIGTIIYSDQVQKIFDLDEYNSNAKVNHALNHLPMTYGGSRVDEAIRYVRTKSFRRSLTRRDTAQVGLIITASPARYFLLWFLL
jgi:hypothetical protein